MVDNRKNVTIICNIDMAFKDVVNIFLKSCKLNKVKNIIFKFNEKNIDRN